MKWLVILMAVFALTASAADITGTWKGTAETQNGTIERTFIFKQEGQKLTGESVSQRFGKSELMNGKVSGDEVTFSIVMKFGDNEMKLNYKGKVSGDTIKFDVQTEDGSTSITYNCKKVS